MIRPDFTLTTNNKDVSDLLMDKVASVDVIQHSGFISDHCIITLDDHRDARIAPPKPGDLIKIAMGYQQSELIEQGEFQVAEHSFSGARDTLTIYANKLDWSQSLKAPRHKSWQSTVETPLMLSDLLDQIAAKHGLQAKVNAELGAITVPSIEQSESDLQLITKLAAIYDATARLVANYLIFMPRGTGTSRTGSTLPAIALNRIQLINWQMLTSGQPSYKACKAYYHDIVAAERKMVEVGSGSPCYELPYPLADETTAQWAATARFNDFKRTQKTLKASAIGEANLMAGGPINVSGVRADIDGEWVLTQVHHRIDAEGFISTFQSEKSTAQS